MDFVFDRVASGRTIKCLVIVDDATHEAVAIVPEHTHRRRSPHPHPRSASARSAAQPAVIRTDNGPEFTGKAMLNWAHRNGVVLRLIEPGKPNQNAYVESFNGRFRDECLNEHWFVEPRSRSHGDRGLETGIQRGETEEIARRADARQYAKQLAMKAVTMPENSKSIRY